MNILSRLNVIFILFELTTEKLKILTGTYESTNSKKNVAEDCYLFYLSLGFYYFFHIEVHC